MAGDAAPACAKMLNCPACGGQVELRIPGKALSIGCTSCGAVLDATTPEVALISKYQGEMLQPHLKLGTKGRIRGETYELIAYLRRVDVASGWEWDEYLLFNPYKGYRWLTHDHGHWSFVVMTRTSPKSVGTSMSYHGKIYSLFNKGEAKLTYVLGELYWRAKIGEVVNSADYIDPPEMLSSEQDETEVIWSLGEYIEPSAVAAAFPPQRPLPPRSDVAANQPAPYTDAHAFRYAAWIVAALFMTHIVCAAFAKETIATTISDRAARASSGAANDPPKEAVSPPFQLDGRTSGVLVELEAPTLNNNWLAVGMSLVNDATGQSYDFEREIEYYSGADADGSWSEGATRGDVVVPDVPSGAYRLVYQAESGAASQDFTITLKRGSIHWSNLWTLIVITLLFPTWAMIRDYRMNLRRWSNSDYAPPQYRRSHG